MKQRWQCEKCLEVYDTADEAQKCESRHSQFSRVEQVIWETFSEVPSKVKLSFSSNGETYSLWFERMSPIAIAQDKIWRSQM